VLKFVHESVLSPDAAVTFRVPRAGDGPAVTALIARCPPLDANSVYCNLLQCTHFAETCLLAERDGEIAGWISGYRLPDKPDHFFLWQVAVSPSAQGEGLGGRMLDALFQRPGLRGVTHMQTTITPGNEASWALFRGFARRLGTPISDGPFFDRDEHFGGGHASEHLVTIGPFGGAHPAS